jgi:hypothetical protein
LKDVTPKMFSIITKSKNVINKRKEKKSEFWLISSEIHVLKLMVKIVSSEKKKKKKIIN